MHELPQRSDLLHRRVERFTRMLQGVDKGEVRAVHRARVASRRLRELVPVLQLDRDTSEKMGRRLKRVAKRLGSVRELDVLIQLIDELRKSGDYSDAALQAVAADAGNARETLHHKVCGHRASDERRRVARKLEKIFRQLEKDGASKSDRAWRWAMDARIARRAATVQQAIAHAGAVYLPERLHLVRIALKKLRYGLELAAESRVAKVANVAKDAHVAKGHKASADIATIKRSQEILGRMHDLQVLIDRVRHVHTALDPHARSLRKEMNTLAMGLDRSCRRLHARYVRQRSRLVEIARGLTDRSAALSKDAPSRSAMSKAAIRRAG